MLRWQQKKQLQQQLEYKQIGDIAYNVLIGHILLMLIVSCIAQYKPVTHLVLGKQSGQIRGKKKFSVEFRQLALQEPQLSPTAPKALSPSKPYPAKAKASQSLKTNKVASKIVAAEKKILITKKEQSNVVNLKKVGPKEPPQKTDEPKIKESPKAISAPAKIEALDPQSKPLQPAPPQIVEQQQKNELIELEINGEASEDNTEPMHEIASIIADQWYTVKGMPQDFYVDISFIINAQGKASEMTIINHRGNLIYQVHAKESLSRCDFPKKYYNKKCRIVLKA